MDAKGIFEHLFREHREFLIEHGTDWVIAQAVDLQGKRPRDETRRLVTSVISYHRALLVEGDTAERDRFIDFVTSYRATLDFRISTPLRGLLSFRCALEALLERLQMPPAEKLTLLTLADEAYYGAIFVLGDMYVEKLQAVIRERQGRLQEALERLRTLDDQKTTMYQNVSHEFRTPLTLLIGPLEQLLADTAELPPEIRSDCEMMLRNARRLLRLVNQLLDLSKLDAGRMALDAEPGDIAALLHSLCASFASLAQSRGITYVIDVPRRPVRMMLDADKLEKVFLNLLSNAFKYTPAGGTIAVLLREHDDTVTIHVRDDGDGIAAAELPHIFERFRQVATSPTRHQGTGIGLALVKEFVELHDGSVAVHSELGAGTELVVRLPRSRRGERLSPVSAAPPSSATSGQLASRLEWLPLPDDEASLIADPDAAQGRPTVLVVDDNPDMHRYIRGILGAEYFLLRAHDGREGLEKALAYSPDIILSDVMMPVMNGYELLHEVRAHHERRSLPLVPFILITAAVSAAGRVEGLEHGADDYLAKPFDAKELRARVRNLLRLKAHEREVEKLNRHLAESVLKRYLPPTLVDEIVSGRAQIDAAPRRAFVTVLYADLVDFTHLTLDIGPELTAQVLNQYLTLMTETVFGFGGTVDKFMGDAVLVLFGAPVAQLERMQALSAVRCAASMQQALAQQRREVTGTGWPALHMRIGIDCGIAVVGHFGNQRRSDYTAVGPCVNRADRIQRVCEPDQVFVSQPVQMLLPPSLFEPAGEFALKGIDKPVRCYRLQLRAIEEQSLRDAALPPA